MLTRSKTAKQAATQQQTSSSPSICWDREATPQYVYRFCVASDQLPADLTVYEDQVLGVGSFGTVLKGYYQGEQVAVKFVALDTNIPTVDCVSSINEDDCLQYSTKEFNQEVKQSIFTSKLGISPNILSYRIVDLSAYKTPSKLAKPLIAPKKIGVIVSEMLGTSLSKYLEENRHLLDELKLTIFREYISISKILFDAGYHHMDNHFGNILIDPQTMQLKFIDIDLKSITAMSAIKSWDDMINKLHRDFIMQYKMYER